MITNENVLLAQAGNEDALEEVLHMAQRFAFKKMARYNIDVNDIEDIQQEVSIKVWKAIMDYDETKGTSAFNWVAMAVANVINDYFAYIMRQQRNKHNEAMSLNQKVKLDGLKEKEYIDYIKTYDIDVVEHLENVEKLKEIVSLATELERKVLAARYFGYNLRDMSIFGFTEKRADNTWNRIRNRAKAHYGITEPTQRGKVAPEDAKDLLWMKQNGYTRQQIANKFGITKAYVNVWIKRNKGAIENV